MPLRLKSLELHGYKTFASRIKFEFSERITAIVGPNGSGKSNIADALRWALGEQSYSILRGKKTEDMIFAGSDNRARAGMASVLLTFDNSDNWLPIDFSEVDLSRRAYRDGRNDYLINSQQVRLKDLNELLAQSGLSERTYTILGQGLVDASLALKADERRKLFEEAAGIGIYRSRRAEALKRLDITNRNLDRVMDILAELQPRLKSLSRQARKATEYQQVQADLKSTLLEWYGFHWNRSQKDMNEAREIVSTHASRVEESRDDYQSIRNEYLGFRDKLQSLRSRLNSWHRESSQLHSNRELISREMAVLEERRNRLEDNRKDVTLEIGRIDNEISMTSDRFHEVSEDLERLRSDMQDSKERFSSSQETLKLRKNERLALEEVLTNVRKEYNLANNRRELLFIQEKEMQKRLTSLKADLDENSKTLATLNEKDKVLSQEYSSISQYRGQLEKTLEGLIAQIEEITNNLERLRSERTEKSSKLNDLEAEDSGISAQMDVLIRSEETFAGYAEGAKALLESAKEKKLKSKIHAISSLVDIPTPLENVISIALGDFVDSLIFDSDEDVDEAITILDSREEGRATILHIDNLIYDNNLNLPRDEGIIGLASDLVSILPEYKPALDYLLNKFIIVKDRKTALKIIHNLPYDIKVVTLMGDIYYANGPIRTGKHSTSGIISRKRTIRECKERLNEISQIKQELLSGIENIDKAIEDLKEDLIENNSQYSSKANELDESRSNESNIFRKIDSLKQKNDLLVEQQSRLQSDLISTSNNLKKNVQMVSVLENKIKENEDLINVQTSALSAIVVDELVEQVTYWSSQVAVAEHTLGDLTKRVEEYSNQITKQKNLKIELDKRFENYEHSILEIDKKKVELREQESEFSLKLEKLRSLIDPGESELENAEKQESLLQEKETQSQFLLAKVERYNNKIQMDFERKQEAVGTLRQKIEDDFGLVEFDYASNVDGPVPLPFDGMVEQLVTIDVLPPDLEETLSRQRIRLRRLGPVNPEAQTEYDSVSQRHSFLGSQLEDLKKAVIDTQQVITELDEITRQEFLNTFNAVAVEFKSIFHRLFGGGSARLLLTDPENLTDTGIDIEARLPGRREQGLALLSGGERSLTAIALIFSLLRVSPTPVCVMDEVDAMLDEANVGRFRDLLEELSQDTQFIIITHNRNTVQAADIIYGVTMGMDSVSQIISLKLDQVSDELLLGKSS